MMRVCVVCSQRSAGVPCPQRRLGIRGCAQRGLWPQTLCPTRIPPEYVSPGLYKRIQFVAFLRSSYVADDIWRFA